MSSSSSSSLTSTSLLSSLRRQLSPSCHINDETGNVFVHVIDGDGNFNCTAHDLSYLVVSARNSDSLEKPIDALPPYALVGIMGCQSTGKSTLLNLLFRTKFQEMDSTKGRSQTTKGVWLDTGALKKDLVVMDLEGTDSGERGEDRTTFERQTALYALAVAEVLIINMWEHDIGRYTASNYGILKTVFEVDLQLFHNSTASASKKEAPSKTTLLFIIRDHIEEDTPFDSLKEKLLVEIHKIWSEIRKPDQYLQSPIADFFEFEFCALPHMKLQKELFQREVDSLRERFINPVREDYLFKREYYGRKNVPVETFGHYLANIWNVVKENKELDMPTQKALLATFRCDEIISEQLVVFKEQTKQLKASCQQQLVDNFAPSCDATVHALMQYFDNHTHHYYKEIVVQKRQQLLKALADELYETWAVQVQFLNKQVLAGFTAELELDEKEKEKEESAARQDIPADFANRAQSLYDSYFESYSSLLTASIPTAFTELWSTTHVDKLVQEIAVEMKTIIQTKRKDILTYLKNTIIPRRMKADPLMAADISKTVKLAQSTMWHDLAAIYLKVTNKLKAYLQDIFVSYTFTEQEKENLLAAISHNIKENITQAVVAQKDMIGLHLRQKFDQLFRYDSTGTLRRWGGNVNIRAEYSYAKERSLRLLDLFQYNQLDHSIKHYQDRVKHNSNTKNKNAAAHTSTPTGDEPRNESKSNYDGFSVEWEDKFPYQPEDKDTLISAADRSKEEQLFLYNIEGALRDAEDAQARENANSKIPPWAIVAFVYFAIDDILAWLRNPVLLAFMLMLAGGLYVLHTMHLLKPTVKLGVNIATNFANTVFSQLTQAGDFSNLATADSSSSQPPSSTPQGHSRASSYAMKDKDESVTADATLTARRKGDKDE